MWLAGSGTWPQEWCCTGLAVSQHVGSSQIRDGTQGSSIDRQILNQVLGKPHQQFFEPYYNIGEGNGTPLQYSCLENPMDGGDWWATVHGVAQSRTRLSDFTFTFHFQGLPWRRQWHPTPVLLPGESQGWGSLVGCPFMGSHRVGHD